MQPYFAPYLGYFSLLKHTDRFILFDTPQFIRHGWIERNRILKPGGGWQYIQVPLFKYSQETNIKDIEINNSIIWKDKILAQLQHYKKSAPYYYKTIALFRNVFESEYSDIVSLDKKVLENICQYLGIDKKIEVFSALDLIIEPVNAPDEWALNICKAIGGIQEYWNPPGGQSFFDKQKYEIAKIELKFHTILLPEYNQKNSNFESGLSIIDVLMFNSVEEINIMLDNFELK